MRDADDDGVGTFPGDPACPRRKRAPWREKSVLGHWPIPHWPSLCSLERSVSRFLDSWARPKPPV